MANSDWSDFLIQIHPSDTILVLARSVEEGEPFVLDGREYRFACKLGLGHKVARRPIALGEKVLKYGVPIGSATRAIGAGQHVHLHNLKSDYLPTYTLEEGNRYGE